MYNYTQGYQIQPTAENYYYAYMNLYAQEIERTSAMSYSTPSLGQILEPCEELTKTKETRIKCQSCEKVFPSEKQARTHHKNIHEKISQVTCSKCGRIFSNKYVLKKHNTRHHPPTASIS
ncbi:hypothetical protein SteCoe_645 [Stentor coeruleus]|uniref:C2H2-type domain-containing protein n=1 Tax=Stentor coeruleus TaxID=5963 RepID=A0A1R2D3X7_9CILI|nr:hypothetical protein SteCoe_645 [Stentor coeruleus]